MDSVKDSVKEDFIKKLTGKLNSVNVDKIYNKERTLDVCYLISSLDQHIEECKEFMDDISKNKYSFNGYEDDYTNGYTNGKIRILIEKPLEERESEYMVDAYYNYYYFIEFTYDERNWGYCGCSPEDEGYNKSNKCCGMGCDWTAPSFSLKKETYMHYGKWDGQEKDYWEYVENFNEEENNKNKEVEEYNKRESIKRINSQIVELQNKLKKLEE